MSELLYFNGINGLTGTYGLEPMTGEQFYGFITGEKHAKPDYSDALQYRRDQERLKHIYKEERSIQAEQERLRADPVAKGPGIVAQQTSALEALSKGLDREKRDLESKGVKFGIDPTNLAQAGWGIIFGTPGSLTSQVEEALSPLLDLRRGQTDHFNIYKEGQGYRPGLTARKFLSHHGGTRLADPADPERVPYYLLIVGSPEDVDYSFQYQLDVQYAVGRIDFGDDIQAYANYARNVVQAETGGIKVAPRATFVGTANPDDQATNSSADHLVRPLYEHLKDSYPKWHMDILLQDEATKDSLLRLIGGPEPPAFLFTASHGMEFPLDDPKNRQVPHQGALLCHDWPGPNNWHGEIPQDFYLAGDDLTDEANLIGRIAFFFACYGAGTPLYDEFSKQAFKDRPNAIAAHPFVAALPKAMLSLSQGALAVVSHVERAWGTSFLGSRETEQITVFKSAAEHLLKGFPVGSAMEYFDSRHAALSTELTMTLEGADFAFGAASPDPYKVAAMWTANNDARGYVIIGDPAARLSTAQVEDSERPTHVATLDLASPPAADILTKPDDASFPDADWQRTPHSVKAYIYGLRSIASKSPTFPTREPLAFLSDKYPSTRVTAHLEVETISGSNLLFCAAFQIAWDQLRDDILDGSPVQLEADPLMARALNRQLVGKQDISEDYYLAMAGFGRDRIVERIEEALQRRFSRSPGLDLRCRPDDILTYAFLDKNIPFDTTFEILDAPISFSDAIQVQAFGIEKKRAAAGQVVIVDYVNGDDFVIKLQASPQVDAEIEFGARIDHPRITDDIILAKVLPQPTFLETVQAVLARVRVKKDDQIEATLRPQEILRIPKVDVDILHRYSELSSQVLLNEGCEGYPISEALQAVRFRLDETGAVLKAEAAMLVKGIAPRLFIFDKPFLLCLKEKEAQYPYLAIWIGNSELLVKA